MLPRHLLAHAGHLKPINPHHRLGLVARGSIPTRAASVFQTSNFHSSSRRQEELPKSPFQTFVEVLREEIRKNREIQEGVKQLHGEVDAVKDSEAMRRAKEAYERARVRSDDLKSHSDFRPPPCSSVLKLTRFRCSSQHPFAKIRS
jgi:mitochondrial import inner membrane translocase subunit TIM44